MNKREWLKFVKHSTEAHHIREIFLGTYLLLPEPEVQDIFLNRINTLLSIRPHPHTRKALEDLKEDIELEIEHGEMRSKVVTRSKIGSSSFYLTDKEKLIKIVDSLEAEIEKLRGMIDAIGYSKLAQDSTNGI
jgi:PleD family two-component response regulator